MTDGTNLSVSPIHLPLIHGENVFLDHYIYLSDLARLIPNPTVLAKVESHPLLRAAILSNHFLAREISYNPALLTMLAKSPELLGAVINNPTLLKIIKENPAIIEEILRNPSQSIETILQNILERKKSTRLGKNIESVAEKKPIQSQVLHKLEKPKVPLAIKEAIAKIGLKIPINIPNIKTIEGKIQAKIPLIQRQNGRIYIDPETLAMHPSLLVLLGAIAFSASRTKVIPISGNPEEVETQTERQLDTLEQIYPIHEVEKASEVHLMKETIT